MQEFIAYVAATSICRRRYWDYYAIGDDLFILSIFSRWFDSMMIEYWNVVYVATIRFTIFCRFFQRLSNRTGTQGAWIYIKDTCQSTLPNSINTVPAISKLGKKGTERVKIACFQIPMFAEMRDQTYMCNTRVMYPMSCCHLLTLVFFFSTANEEDTNQNTCWKTERMGDTIYVVEWVWSKNRGNLNIPISTDCSLFLYYLVWKCEVHFVRANEGACVCVRTKATTIIINLFILGDILCWWWRAHSRDIYFTVHTFQRLLFLS